MTKMIKSCGTLIARPIVTSPIEKSRAIPYELFCTACGAEGHGRLLRAFVTRITNPRQSCALPEKTLAQCGRPAMFQLRI
jgi:hypothetical protein